MAYPRDPVNIEPIPALQDSYSYHSEPHATAPGEEWIMGIDEAGRGPVLGMIRCPLHSITIGEKLTRQGPMVYAAAYCPMSFKTTLEEMGFDDSKALSADVRQALWESFDTNTPLCYSSATLSPQGISAGMLRRVPINLNRQAEDATVSLIKSALDRGINIKECYVDALGPAPQWQARLSAMFPTVQFTVCPKADSLFKIVSAASIVAKVTRDRYIEHWQDAEDVDRSLDEPAEDIARGSGYPSDPRTQAYLKEHLDPVFGYKGIVRFSWATVKVLLEKQGVECKWNDDNQQPSAKSWFASDADNGRPKMWRDLGVAGVGEL